VFDDILKESEASEEARRKGLKYLNFGRWGTQDGKVTYVTIDGKLVPYNPSVHDKDIEFRKGAAAYHKKNGTYNKKPYSGNNGYGKRKYTRKAVPQPATPVNPYDKPFEPPKPKNPDKPKAPVSPELQKSSEQFFSDYSNWVPDNLRKRFVVALSKRLMVKPSKFIKHVYQLPDEINWQVGDNVQDLFRRAPGIKAFFRPVTKSVHLRKESAINLAKLNSFPLEEIESHTSGRKFSMELHQIISDFHALYHECIHAKDPYANNAANMLWASKYQVCLLEGMTEWKAQQLTKITFNVNHSNFDVHEKFYPQEVKMIELLEKIKPGTISALWTASGQDREIIAENVLGNWLKDKLNELGGPETQEKLNIFNTLAAKRRLGFMAMLGLLDEKWLAKSVQEIRKITDVIATRGM
jgi:hypothetical protein